MAMGGQASRRWAEGWSGARTRPPESTTAARPADAVYTRKRRRPGEDPIRRERIGPDRAAGTQHHRHDDAIRRSCCCCCCCCCRRRRRWPPLRRGVLPWARVCLPPRCERPGGRGAGQGNPRQSRAAQSAAKAAQSGGTAAGEAGRGHDGACRVWAALMATPPRPGSRACSRGRRITRPSRSAPAAAVTAGTR